MNIFPLKLNTTHDILPSHPTQQRHPEKTPYTGTQQWYHSPKIGPPTIAYYNVMSTPPKLVVIPAPHHNDTLQWHHIHSPQSWPSPSSPPIITHYNTTMQWHPVMVPHPLPQSWSLPSPPTKHLIHCTLQWHPGTTSNPPKWFVALPPYWK